MVQGRRYSDGLGYSSQLIYLTKKVEEAVDWILERSSVGPIIIIQTNHRQARHSEDSKRLNQLTFDAECIILNAYYLPNTENRDCTLE